MYFSLVTEDRAVAVICRGDLTFLQRKVRAPQDRIPPAEGGARKGTESATENRPLCPAFLCGNGVSSEKAG